MRLTHRRLNLAQAHKRSGQDWCSLDTLFKCGAYGASTSVHKAMRKLQKEGVADILRKTKTTGHLYRITPAGYAKLGMVPHKIQGHDDATSPREGYTKGSPAPRPAGS